MKPIIIFILTLLPYANAQIETTDIEEFDPQLMEASSDLDIIDINQGEEIFYEEPDLELGGSEYINYAQDEIIEENQ